MKKANLFDAQVDQFIQTFQKIPNFNLVQTDETARQLFNKIVFRLSNLSSYKTLVCNHFIPAINKDIVESKHAAQNSKYRSYLKTTEIDFNETLYETIRLAYVGLFHKLENGVGDIVAIVNLIYFEEEDISKWAKEKFNFSVTNWWNFKLTQEINWISNCVKHKDGYPTKEPLPDRFRFFDKSKLIVLTKDSFKSDCELIIKLYSVYLNILICIALHRSITNDIENPSWKKPENIIKEEIDLQIKIENDIKKLLDGLKPITNEVIIE